MNQLDLIFNEYVVTIAQIQARLGQKTAELYTMTEERDALKKQLEQPPPDK